MEKTIYKCHSKNCKEQTDDPLNDGWNYKQIFKLIKKSECIHVPSHYELKIVFFCSNH